MHMKNVIMLVRSMGVTWRNLLLSGLSIVSPSVVCVSKGMERRQDLIHSLDNPPTENQALM